MIRSEGKDMYAGKGWSVFQDTMIAWCWESRKDGVEIAQCVELQKQVINRVRQGQTDIIIMCAKKEEYQGGCSQPIHNIQASQHHHQLHNNDYLSGATSTLPWSLPSVHALNPLPIHFTGNPVLDYVHDPFLVPPPPSSYAGLFNSRANHLRILSDSFGAVGSAPLGLQAELGKMTAQELMDAKALAASKSHSEAERRRRERINNHLAKLRSLLPSTTKTDKASLLAEVIQHVKELKRQTCLIAETSPVPTETDELTVDTSDQDGKFVIKASLCCEDRSDLLPDLIKTLKDLRLKTLKAEITTLGGRVKNVLFITGEEDSGVQQQRCCISSIQEALKSVMEKTCGGETSSGSVKRQRTNVSILEQGTLN
ncbi:hypothetical protein V6N11_073679 [Hibiscus sabdariffa]|uniref:BHLH domain-containing protein n=2 Tax=Hibiscus sabdariffa TaxID=183260 RepID=A0ABR2NU37_9ROSI